LSSNLELTTLTNNINNSNKVCRAIKLVKSFLLSQIRQNRCQ